jgi:hypothetical protein
VLPESTAESPKALNEEKLLFTKVSIKKLPFTQPFTTLPFTYPNALIPNGLILRAPLFTKLGRSL